MIFPVFLRQRRFNWIRQFRLMYFLRNDELIKAIFLNKIIKKNGSISIGKVYSFLVKKYNVTSIYPLSKTRIKNRCLLTGTSRGLRFLVSRLGALHLTYSGKIGSISMARW